MPLAKPRRSAIIVAMPSIDTARGRIGLIQQSPAEPQGLPILFLHGVGSDKSVWQPQLDHFGRSRLALAADYPGYGDSAPAAEAGHDAYARAMLALLDTLGIERAHICGLSLGGVVAIAMGSLAPDRCASLIIADSFAVHPDGQGIHDRSVAASGELGMRALAEARIDLLLGASPPDGLRAACVETMAAIDVASYHQGAASVWLADQVERARALRLPTLILCGDEDKVTPPALSEQLHRLIAESRYQLIEGAGHLANVEKVAAFNHAVEAFLSKLHEKA